MKSGDYNERKDPWNQRYKTTFVHGAIFILPAFWTEQYNTSIWIFRFDNNNKSIRRHENHLKGYNIDYHQHHTSFLSDIWHLYLNVNQNTSLCLNVLCTVFNSSAFVYLWLMILSFVVQKMKGKEVCIQNIFRFLSKYLLVVHLNLLFIYMCV